MSAISTLDTIRARFALPADSGRDRASAFERAAEACASEIDRRLGPAQIALLTGPSGSGKSRILRALRGRAPTSVVAQPITHRSRTPVIELFASTLADRLRILGSCGLGDAHTLVTPAGELSEGQAHRLGLALAFEQARMRDEPCLVTIDEFCSTLDRATAVSIALSIRRLVTPAIRVVCATAHDDLIGALHPDLLVYTPLEALPEILTRSTP